MHHIMLKTIRITCDCIVHHLRSLHDSNSDIVTVDMSPARYILMLTVAIASVMFEQFMLEVTFSYIVSSTETSSLIK